MGICAAGHGEGKKLNSQHIETETEAGQKPRFWHYKHTCRGRNTCFKSHWLVSTRKLMGWADGKSFSSVWMSLLPSGMQDQLDLAHASFLNGTSLPSALCPRRCSIPLLAFVACLVENSPRRKRGNFDKATAIPREGMAAAANLPCL